MTEGQRNQGVHIADNMHEEYNNNKDIITKTTIQSITTQNDISCATMLREWKKGETHYIAHAFKTNEVHKCWWLSAACLHCDLLLHFFNWRKRGACEDFFIIAKLRALPVTNVTFEKRILVCYGLFDWINHE